MDAVETQTESRMKQPSLKYDPALASTFSKATALEHVSILHLEAGLTSGMLKVGPKAKSLSFNIAPINMTWRATDSTLATFLPFSIELESEDVAIAHVKLVLRLDYARKAGGEDEGVKDFVAISSLLHAWPYLRAEVQALTTKLDFPPLVLPTIVSGNAEQLVAKVSQFADSKIVPSPRQRAVVRRKRGSAKQ